MSLSGFQFFLFNKFDKLSQICFVIVVYGMQIYVGVKSNLKYLFK